MNLSSEDPDVQAANYIEMRKKELEALQNEYKDQPIQKSEDNMDDLWTGDIKLESSDQKEQEASKDQDEDSPDDADSADPDQSQDAYENRKNPTTRVNNLRKNAFNTYSIQKETRQFSEVPEVPGNLEETHSKIDESSKDEEGVSDQTKIVKDVSYSQIGLQVVQDDFIDDYSDMGDEFEENKSYMDQKDNSSQLNKDLSTTPITNIILPSQSQMDLIKKFKNIGSKIN